MRIVAGIEHRLKELEAMERMLKMPVNVYVSDIFFNMDVTGAYNEETGFDRAVLTDEAVWILGCLKDLGVDEKLLPNADELVDNFLERV